VSADLERFEELVVRDHELAAALWAETDPSAFVETLVRLAAERSLRISADDVRQAMFDQRARWWKRYDE
jgi:hypothetical protein